MAKMEDLIVKAYRKAGLEPPKRASPASEAAKPKAPHKVDPKFQIKRKMGGKPHQGFRSGKSKSRPSREQQATLSQAAAAPGPFNVPVVRITKPVTQVPQKKPFQQAQKKVADAVPFADQCKLRLGGTASPNWQRARRQDERPQLFSYWKSSVPRRQGTEEVELSLGLDFGTSAVKVIISDRAQQKAYAVPFHSHTDSSRYLLPSQLFLTNGVASLENGEVCHSDLKMRLIDSIDDRDNQIRTAMFMALVLKHSINWLCSEYQDIYTTTAIAWRLSVGFPSSQLNQHEGAYRKFIQTAWLLAYSPSPLTLALATKAYEIISDKLEKERDKNVIGIDLAIVPELAAQIYGYVSSDGFDPHDQKAFLLVDVGAGTVDAAVFRPSRSKGKTRYDFYTTTVEPNGVMMLHRNRLFWWRKVLGQIIPGRTQLQQAVERSTTSPDTQSIIPAEVADYFTEVSLSFAKDEFNPDAAFFKSFRHQVVTSTLMQAQKEGHWEKKDLLDIPFYLCGGGSRMPFYRTLLTELGYRHSNISWLKASPRSLVVPRNLIAPYLAKEDYDRLSVAYGLSLDDVGEVLKHQPTTTGMPNPLKPVHRPWWDSYPEK